MTQYSKFNIVYRLQKWMDSVPGQTFLNYAYSWGASIVILGTLFKLTHLPGANFMLFVGMGTEVFVFFISAFDRPFDKTADGRDIPTHATEEYLEGEETAEEVDAENLGYQPRVAATAAPQGVWTASTAVQSQAASETQGAMPGADTAEPAAEGTTNAAEAAQAAAYAPTDGAATVQQPVQPVAQPSFVPQMSAEEAEALNEAQSNYVDELKKLVETLGKVNEQSSRLTRDSEEMENLNRTLTGISKVYEVQLKGASKQIGTIDQINEQSKKLAEQIEQLNKIYARMIEAMTVNMHAQAPTANPGE